MINMSLTETNILRERSYRVSTQYGFFVEVNIPVATITNENKNVLLSIDI